MKLHEVRTRVRKLRKNIWVLLQFEAIFKLMIIVFAVPAVSGLESLAMRISGYSYLTMENMRRFAVHPLTLLLILAVALGMMFLMLMDLSAVIFNLHSAYHGISTDLAHTVLYALRQTAGLFRSERKWRLLLVLLVQLPIFSIGVFPALTGNLLVQEWVVQQVRKHFYVLVGAAVTGLFLTMMFFRWMYVFQIRILEGCSLREAKARSVALGRKRHLGDLFFFFLTQVLCYVGYALFLGIAMLLAFLLEKLLGNTSLVNPVSTSVMLTITTISMMLLVSETAPASCLCIAARYYRHKLEDDAPVPGPEAVDCPLPPLPEHYRLLLRILLRLILLVTVVVSGAYVFLTYKGRLNLNIEYLHQTEVTAHRGASRYFPENTMAAFRGAVEQGADWIELDIHQSADGVLYVMHDHSPYRTCGVKGYGWNFTWEELSRMDAGRKFGINFAGERIPTLEEVIDYALESGVRLNIEIKPSVYEEGLEERLVELLHEKDFVSECVVTSQKYTSIQQVKELDEEINTVYVMGYAFGNVDRLSAADHFSVNVGSISARLVSRIHNAGGQVYAWTANSRVNIESMVEKNVDNIITDDVRLAKAIVGESRTSSALHEYIRWLGVWFR